MVADCSIDIKKLDVKIIDMKILRTGSAGIVLATLLAPIAWGTTYITITEFLPGGRPLLVATMRVIPAGIALLLVGRLFSSWQPRRDDWQRLGTVSLFNFGIFFPLLIVGVYRLPGGVAAATSGLQPLLVLLITRLLSGSKQRGLDMAVAAIAAVGVGMVVLRPDAGIDPIGVAAAVAANASFATGAVLTKRYPSPGNRITATGWQLLMSSVVLLPLTLAVEGLPATVSTTNLAGFAYLSLAGTALAFVLWFNGIRRLPVAGPPLLGLAVPVTGAVLGWLFLSESLSVIQLLGFAVTISAIGYGANLRTTPADTADAAPLPSPLARDCHPCAA